jgi:hypothetical protein
VKGLEQVIAAARTARIAGLGLLAVVIEIEIEIGIEIGIAIEIATPIAVSNLVSAFP